MERNNAFINIYEDEVLEQSKESCKPLLNNYKTEDQTNNSSAIRESCYSFCNEGGNTEEEPKGNANAHGCIQDTKFSCNNRSMDATECRNIGSEYNVDEKLELVILENNDKIKKTSILDEQDEFNDGDIADTKDSSLIHTENNISIQIEGQLGRAVGQHENRSETNTRKTFAVKDEKTNNQITEESDDVNKFGNMNLVEGEPIKKSFNKITLESDNRESEINSESKTIEKKKKNKMKTLAFVLAENVETQYCSLDPNDRALADHEQVYNTIRKDSTDNEENKNYLLDKICRTLEDREHIYNDTKDDLKPETEVKQDLDRTNLDKNYGMRNSFDDIEDERRQHENNDDSYHLTELKSIANHASIENNEAECEISDVSIINSFDEVNEENSDGQVNLIEDNEAIYESIRDEDSLRDFRFQDFDENERFYRRRERRKQIFQVLVVGILSIMMMTVIALVISLKNENQQIKDSNQKTTKKADSKLTESCPRGWKLYKRHCYFFSLQNALNWDQAKNECSRKGSHLVKVDNRAEDLWLQTNIENDGVWIDAIDKWHEGHWISYSDGTSLPYTAWKKGEPNDENYSEDCAYMRIDGWNDCPCNERILYVCEKEM